MLIGTKELQIKSCVEITELNLIENPNGITC